LTTASTRPAASAVNAPARSSKGAYYAVGVDVAVSASEGTDAIDGAARFVGAIERVLSEER
jgi:hypothetical protein